MLSSGIESEISDFDKGLIHPILQPAISIKFESDKIFFGTKKSGKIRIDEKSNIIF